MNSTATVGQLKLQRGNVRKKIVLIADREDDSRLNLKLLLNIHNCEVIEACDGEQAVELARERQPGLIIMDLILPVMDGFEATKIIRSTRKTRTIPIVVFSAYSDIDTVCRKALDAGANRCISKPIPVNQLKILLKRHYR